MSYTPSARNSNIEILRLLTMVMVLALHANFLASSLPSPRLDFVDVSRTLLQSLCICSVNLFVMISGWFGIRASLKGFLNLMWTVAFFVAILLLVQGYAGYEPARPKEFIMLFSMAGGGGWFVPAYMVMYILSPVLNSFILNSSVKRIGCVVLSFFCFQLLWGLWGDAGFISMGYSPVSFFGLYIFAGLLRRIRLRWTLRRWTAIFIASWVINAFLYIFLSRVTTGDYYREMVFSYINPLVILEAASLLMGVVSLKERHNRICNSLGRSAFAIYLAHVGTPLALHAYLCKIQLVYHTWNGFACFAHVAYVILCVVVGAILLDRVRLFLWWLAVRGFDRLRLRICGGNPSL